MTTFSFTFTDLGFYPFCAFFFFSKNNHIHTLLIFFFPFLNLLGHATAQCWLHFCYTTKWFSLYNCLFLIIKEAYYHVLCFFLHTSLKLLHIGFFSQWMSLSRWLHRSSFYDYTIIYLVSYEWMAWIIFYKLPSLHIQWCMYNLVCMCGSTTSGQIPRSGASASKGQKLKEHIVCVRFSLSLAYRMDFKRF